jgi:hypothetical protein
MIVARVIAQKMVSQQNALWWHALGNVITQKEVRVTENKTVLSYNINDCK